MIRLTFLLLLLIPVMAWAADTKVIIVVGAELGGVVWEKIVPDAVRISVAQLPADAQALAARGNVLICKPDVLTAAQQMAIEAFVRGGGGLLIDGGGDRSRWRGKILDMISPAIGTYETSIALPRSIASNSSPLNGLNLTDFPRIGRVVSAASPDRAPVGYLNNLSAWYHNKPLWQDDWRYWLQGNDPAATPLLSSASYGAGRVAIASWIKVADGNAPALIEVLSRLLSWLTGDGKVIPENLIFLSLKGYRLPVWYADPLEKGMRGLGDKQTIADFILPPEAFQEAGFSVVDKTDLMEILLGEEAATLSDAAVVLRAPSGETLKQENFDQTKLTVISAIQKATLDGAEVTLPHRMAKFDGVLPTLSLLTGQPAVTLPENWRMAFTNDTDSDRDLREGWQALTLNDAGWQTGKIGAQKSTVFGKEMGYDGAIWYRGTIEVAQEAIMPNAALRCEARDTKGFLTIYIDGKQVACEPRLALLPLSVIGPGKHLLAVRVYGELRSNTGLTTLSLCYLPLLWKADTYGEGWKKGWYKPEVDINGWQAVSDSFAHEPAGRGPQEGWLRMELTVPANTTPYVAAISYNLNVTSVCFVNSKRVGASAPTRVGEYILPDSIFKPGRNSIVMWTSFSDRQGRNFSFRIMPAKQEVYRAVVNSDRAGRSLRAVLNYQNVNWQHTAGDVSILVNGKAVGGCVNNTGATVILFAPYALQAGENKVEVRMAREQDVLCGLERLEVVEVPPTMASILPGWKSCPLEQITGSWQDAKLDDQNWTPVSAVANNEFERDWIPATVPNLDFEGVAYRTHLLLTPDDLSRIFTLYLRHAMVDIIYVNGTPVAADDEWYYSLNSSLRAGDNVLAFVPQRGRFRGLNLPVPGGREGHTQMPQLRADRAPLLPVDPRLKAFRLNRTFPVTAAPAPAGSALFVWPNGVPAVTQLAGKQEVSLAPGLLDSPLPAPNIGSSAHFTGGANTQEYEMVTRLNEDGFGGDRKDQLFPALLNAVASRPSFVDAVVSGKTISLTVNASGAFQGKVAWRLLNWEGTPLTAGVSQVDKKANALTVVAIPLPDLSSLSLPEGTALGRYVRLRAALLSDDRRIPYAFLDRHFTPSPPVTLTFTGPRKEDTAGELTGDYLHRVLHISNGQLSERTLFVLGEAISYSATLCNRTTAPQSIVITLTARPAQGGASVVRSVPLTLAPGAVHPISLTLDDKQTTREQPWELLAEVTQDGQIITRLRKSMVVAKPRGIVVSLAEVTKDNRQTGGYMWQMTPHAFTIEHRSGTDAQPVPEGGPWWTKVRAAGDGNWLVAAGIHRGEGGGDQADLLWGPCYDQTRGEIMDSYGWFPNGENIRAWWAPAAMREPLRAAGGRPVVLALSDWWQNDAGFPWNSYASLQMFNNFLLANKGRTVAGKLLDGIPISAETMDEMRKSINTNYKDVYTYFVTAGLARCAEYTGQQLAAAAPGSTQAGQGSYASALPAAVDGITLGPQWANAESQGYLDADNHPFAGDWQYGLETTTFRAIGIENHMLTNWEMPMNYHADRSFTWMSSPLPTARWQRRLLDSRWLAIADQQGKFQRVFNTEHTERMMEQLIPITKGDIGGGVLPAHWAVKDRLAALAMTIAPQQPLSPLLLVGESRMDWTQYYGILGRFRQAGLTIGGGISLSQLNKLKASQIPALVWPVAEEVDGALLAAVQQKIAEGVPVLLIGNVPRSIGTGPDLRAQLGVRLEEAAVTGAVQQSADPQLTDSDSHLLAQTPVLAPGINRYTANGMNALITRNGRLMLGRSGKVIFYAMTPKGLWDQDDPTVFRLAVRAFDDAMGHPVIWPEGTGGYCFIGQDGTTYAVVENLQNQPRMVSLRFAPPIRATSAVDLLTAQSLTVLDGDNGCNVMLWLDSAGGTIIKLVN